MRLLGHILLWLGFFIGAFYMVASLENKNDPWATINWVWYLGALLIGSVGVVLLQITSRIIGTKAHELEADLKDLNISLAKLVDSVSRMNADFDNISVFSVHERIDADLAVEFGRFADARKAMIHRFGLATYAAIMTEFANGERAVNRAWSASADGYIDEVRLSLDRAQRRLSKAKQLFDANYGDGATKSGFDHSAPNVG